MKKTCGQLCLIALLLVAVPVVGHSVKTQPSNAARLVGTSPVQVANALPVPWPKKPGVSEIPTVTAEAFPIPWPKKPGVSDMPTVTAEAFPIPWPKKPGFVLS